MANVRKQYAVLGLGHFGMSLAVTLQQSGCDVIAVDSQMEHVDAVKERVSMAMCAKMENEKLIRSLAEESLDGVIIAAGSNMEASVMATMLVREAGVPFILAKAKTPLQADVLKKVGADLVIRSEEEMGRRVAEQLVSGAIELPESN